MVEGERELAFTVERTDDGDEGPGPAAPLLPCFTALLAARGTKVDFNLFGGFGTLLFRFGFELLGACSSLSMLCLINFDAMTEAVRFLLGLLISTIRRGSPPAAPSASLA